MVANSTMITVSNFETDITSYGRGTTRVIKSTQLELIFGLDSTIIKNFARAYYRDELKSKAN